MTRRAVKVYKSEAEEQMQNFINADNEIQDIKAQMEAEIEEIRKKYSTQMENAQLRKQSAFDRLEKYAEQNESSLFGKSKKSASILGGTIGYRTTSPKVVLLKSEDEVIEHIEDVAPEYVQITKSVSKASILANKKSDMVHLFEEEGLIKINQEEIFYVKH